MRDISYEKVNVVISEVFAQIRELRLKGDIHKDDEEKIVLSAINNMGINEREPIFGVIKAEFDKIINYKEG